MYPLRHVVHQIQIHIFSDGKLLALGLAPLQDKLYAGK